MFKRQIHLLSLSHIYFSSECPKPVDATTIHPSGQSRILRAILDIFLSSAPPSLHSVHQVPSHFISIPNQFWVSLLISISAIHWVNSPLSFPRTPCSLGFLAPLVADNTGNMLSRFPFGGKTCFLAMESVDSPLTACFISCRYPPCLGSCSTPGDPLEGA